MAQLNTDTSSYKTRILPLPNIGYSPDTKLVVGAFALMQFKPKKAGGDTRSSNIMASFAYTLKNQLSFETYYNVVFPEENWLWNGDLFFQRWPVSYWGVGIDTKASDEILIDYKTIASRQSIYRKILPGVYAGPLLRYGSMYDLKYESLQNDPLDPPPVTGNEGYNLFGLGFGGTWDRRNRILTPTMNHYLEVSFTFFTDNQMGDYSFENIMIDARKYLDFDTDGKSVLAFQTLISLNYGEVPFREMALIGGNRMMRGYIEGRFRDNTGVQLQSEFRRLIKGRIGMAVFGALGNVAPELSEIELEKTKWTLGSGIRYNINKQDPTFIRVDYGIGNNTSGFYVTLGEAF
jgi:outer membrane protein assembly factor BamA